MAEKKQMSYYLWTEKFRPETINDVILPMATKRFFSKLVKEKQIPNLILFSVTPGSGKTSVAKALCKDIGADYLYINASSEGGIDTLRDQIKKFASSKSFSGNPKVAILDEFDGTSNTFQAAFRGFSEEFHNSCRFILTCNYITKIIEPLKSRCQLVDFNVSDKKIKEEMVPKIQKRLCGILKFEKVDYTEEIVTKVVETFYPDIRKMLSLFQQYSKIYDKIDDGVFNYERVDSELYDFVLNKKFTSAREYIIQKNYNYDELYTSFYKDFVPLIKKEFQAQTIITLAQYQNMNAFAINKELNFAACMLEIIGIISQEEG